MIFIYIVLLIISILFYILYKGVISFLILVFAVVLPIIMLAALLYVKHKISISLSLKNRRCSVGQSVPVDIEICSRSIIPILSCEITIEFILSSAQQPEKIRINTPVFPKNTQKLSTAFSSSHYGVVNCRITKVKIYDMLRLFRANIKPKKIRQDESPVLILPDTLELSNAISDYSDLGLDSDKFSSVKPGDDPSEIFSIHEYQDGDKLSKVHWKLTAKEDKLMVKDYSLPLADAFLIVTDTYIPPNKSETAAAAYDTLIKLTASVSRLFLENQIRHRVIAYSEKEQSISEESVTDEDTYISACTKLLMAGSCSKPSLAAMSLIHEDESRQRYGHLILITSVLDSKAADMLISCGMAFRFTILVCSDEGSPDQNLPLNSNAEIIQVRRSSIEQSIADLVF